MADAAHGAQQPAGRSRPRRRLRRLGAVLLGLSTLAAVCIIDAESMPGDDPFEVKLGIWAREHGLGFAVTWYEQVQYALNPPATGGTASVSKVLEDSKFTAPAPPAIKYQPLKPIDRESPLPDEGTWHTLVESQGVPVLSLALLRPDSEHTGYLSAIVRINSKHARLNLHPGSEDPGNPQRFGVQPVITRAQWRDLVGAFNGGFKVKDSQGGFYLNGATAGTLTSGAASLVTYKNGRSDIGAWGTDVTMTSNVQSVRQNLRLLVDDGRITPSADAAVKSNWGATLGGAYYVWRTGIGVRADGDLVFAFGDALSARTLARLLKTAGAVRAMQLDINRDWAAFYYFTHQAGEPQARPTPHKAIPFRKPLGRYFTTVTRDFYTITLRK